MSTRIEECLASGRSPRSWTASQMCRKGIEGENYAGYAPLARFFASCSGVRLATPLEPGPVRRFLLSG